MDKNKLSTQSLVFGILSLALADTGILGIIFGAIGKSRAKAFAEQNDGVLTGKAKVGSILAKLGFVFGIICLVCWALILVACILSPEFRQAFFEGVLEYGF